MSRISIMTPLTAVTRRTQVVDALREAILSGGLRPGTKITEQELSDRLGVSRGPIREAIRDLIDEGLLESQPYTGTYVSVMGQKALMQSYGLRRVLEKYAFTLVWPMRNEVFRAEMRRRYAALLATAASGNVMGELSAEISFHSYPSEFSGDEILLNTWRHLTQRMHLGFILHHAAPGSPDTVTMHERYLELVLGDDLGALLSEIDVHIDWGQKMMDRMASKESG